MNYVDALAQLVRSAFRELLGEPEGYVRPANQTRPTGTVGTDFATVLLEGLDTKTTVHRRGEEPTSPDVTSMNLIIDALDHFTVSVQFFRPRVQVEEGDVGALVDAAGIPEQSQWALSRAQHLVKMLRTPQARFALQPRGLGYIRALTKPKDLTALNDSLWESRAQVKLEMSIPNRQVLVVQILSAIAGQLKFSPPGGSVVSTNIEVPS